MVITWKAYSVSLSSAVYNNLWKRLTNVNCYAALLYKAALHDTRNLQLRYKLYSCEGQSCCRLLIQVKHNIVNHFNTKFKLF